jgi:pimeloyl-ACP methyl ester carboxylesterase
MSSPTAFTTLEQVRLETLCLPAPAGSPPRAPLVFLHEGLGSVSMWRQRDRHWPQELVVASGRAGWLWSRRGYGHSDPIPDVRGPSTGTGFWHQGRHRPDYMHREAFEVLPKLLEAWGIERPVLVGHSDGATIALLHASRHPVTACIAMAPHVMVEDVGLQAIARAREAYLSTDLRARLGRHHQDVDNAFWQWNDVWLSDAFRDFDIRQDCSHIRSPLLVVQGRGDEYGTLRQLDEILRAAPQGQPLVLEDCGHSPHRDQPDRLLEQVGAFLQTLD